MMALGKTTLHRPDGSPTVERAVVRLHRMDHRRIDDVLFSCQRLPAVAGDHLGSFDLDQDPKIKAQKRRKPGPLWGARLSCDLRRETVGYMKPGLPGSRGLIAWAAAWFCPT